MKTTFSQLDTDGSMKRTVFAALLFVVASSSHARADEADIDVRSAEYLDVVQTADGSVWKGIVIEQTPNVVYKIATADGSVHVIKAADVVKMTKQRNKHYHARTAPARDAPDAPETAADATGDRGLDVWRDTSPSGWGLPPPTTGFRLEAASVLAFPTSDVGNISSISFSPDIRVGYEVMFGNFGIEGGGMARFTDWRLNGDSSDTLWTMETMAYGRVAFHISRFAVHAGIALGIDTNHYYDSTSDMSGTTVGFGMNLQSGIAIAASPTLAFKLGFDYHPGTDSIADGSNASVSYVALLFGAGLRM
jgi:hypothetical protein